MATIKANKDKARFISNTISQDALDGDWVDHEVITKYKLPEIVVDASTSTVYPNKDGIVSPTEITTGDKLKVLDGASMVDRTAGTVSTGGTSGGDAVVPTMTSSSLPSGLVFASSNYPTYDPFRLFDDVNSGSGWISANGSALPQFIGYKGLTSKIVDSYTIYGTNDGNTASMMKNWVLEGSNNTTNGTDGTWTAIDTQTNITTWTPLVDKTFTFTNSTAYTAFRFYITANNGYGSYVSAGTDAILIEKSGLLYQAPITATTNIPTKAYFNKTIDTTLSAEATSKCKSSTITQIGVL